MTRSEKIISGVLHLAIFLLAIAFSFGISYWLYVWAGYPRGNDAVGQVFKIKTMAFFWPHFDWIHAWAGGMPMFLRYPWFSYWPLALINKFTGLDAGLLLTGAGVLATAVTGVGIFLLVWETTRARLPALASLLFYILTPASWSYAFSGGLYARAYAMPFLSLSLWAFVRFVKSKSKFSYFLTVIFLAISFLNHYIIGAIAFLLVGLLGFLIVDGLIKKITVVAKIAIPALLLTSLFVIPFVASKPTTNWLGDVSELTQPVTWQELFNFFAGSFEFNSFYLNRLSPFIFPLIGLLLILFFVFGRNNLGKNSLATKITLFLTVINLVLLVYVRVIIDRFDLLYAIVGIPVGMLQYISILGSALVGILLFLVFENKFLRQISCLLLITISFVWVKIQYVDALGSLKIKHFAPETYQTQPLITLEKLYATKEEEFNFRLGTEHAVTGGWFNGRFPYVPQTRDYFGQGVVDQDQRFYLIYSLFHQKGNVEETAYLMDWWAIKTLMVERDNEVGDKYVSSGNYLPLFEEDKASFDIFEYKNPSPILVATDALAVLFIGDSGSYNIFFRDFAPINANSRVLVPLHRHEYVDDFSPEELEAFSVVFLYNYKYRQRNKAEKLLRDYVNSGGALVVEAQDDSLREILPVISYKKTDFGKTWQLEWVKEGFFGDIDLGEFSPAVYKEGPWAVYVADSQKDWAKALVLNSGQPVLVAGDFGKGKVVWSGLNLPYHIDAYKSAEEAELLKNIIFWAAGRSSEVVDFPKDNDSLVYENKDFSVEFVHPQKRVVSLKKKAEGILFKEFYYPNWQARFNGRKLPIYKAGPNFMYVPLSGSNSGDKITLKFTLSPIFVVGAGISLLTFTFLLYYLLGGKIRLPFPKMADKKPKLLLKKLTGWWEED